MPLDDNAGRLPRKTQCAASHGHVTVSVWQGRSSTPHSLRVHYVQAAASPVAVVTGSIDSRHSRRG